MTKVNISCFHLICLVIFSVFPIFLRAEVFEYKISYLGIQVAEINIVNNFTHDTGVLRIHTKSKFMNSIFPYANNTYITKYEEEFLPISYEKHIDQKKYFEERLFTYNRDKKTALMHDILKNQKITYSIMPTSRDFFSALLFIASHIQPKDDIWLDANKLIWKATYETEDHEVLNTSIGKLPSIRLKMHFRKISPEPKENTDMLTNQLVNEDGTLYLWISDDSRHLPLKAKYERKPFPVYWEIVSYKP